MGLIKAFTGSVSGELANQWKELFVCDSMDNSVLLKRAEHKVSGRSTNTKGDQDVITKGSVVIVNEGQCAILVDSGKIIVQTKINIEEHLPRLKEIFSYLVSLYKVEDS